jgi:glycosyltransferase involved in cell wall biosynthesis
MVLPELVSILIPAYNAEKWIRQAIASALGQTWSHKEVIVVDDGSTDGTLGIAREFEPRSVKVVTQDNRGASAARNKAFSLSTGDFIQWLDADDLLAPDKIEAQMRCASGGKDGLRLFSSPYGVFYHRQKKAKFVPSSLWQDQKPIDWFIRSFSEHLWMHPAGWLVTRRLTELAGPWDERLSMDDDGEYFARVVAQSEDIVFVNEAKCYYRQSSFRQLSKNFSEKALDSRFLSTKLKIRCFLSLEDSDRTKTACIALLQANRPYFYPEKTDLLRQMNTLVLELGGNLESLEFNKRFSPMQALLGPRWGKKARTFFRKLRLARAVRWDEVLQKLGL